MFLEGLEGRNDSLISTKFQTDFVLSGCSTLLKTIAGETDGYFIDENSHINYQGISVQQMHNDFRGECIYQAETDVHFPQLTVGQTLEFAAKARGKTLLLK